MCAFESSSWDIQQPGMATRLFDLLLLRVGHLLQNEFLDDGMKFFADLTQIWNKSIQSSKLVSQASSDEFSSMLVE